MSYRSGWRSLAGLAFASFCLVNFNAVAVGEVNKQAAQKAGDEFDLQELLQSFQVQNVTKKGQDGKANDQAAQGSAGKAKSSKSSKASALSKSSKGKSFEGVININGKEIRTNDPTEFAKLQQQIQQQMKGQMGQFPGMAQAQANAANGSFEGVININGKEVRTKDAKEFALLQQQFQEQMKAQEGPFPAFPKGFGQLNGVSTSSFSGVINNNGVVQEFKDPVEFEKAQKQLAVPGIQ